MRKILPIALLSLVLVLACGKESPSAIATPAAVPDAANAAYSIEGKAVILSNGKADEAIAPGSASRNITTLTSFTTTGDIDGDGKPDVVVVLMNNPGGSGTYYYLAALPSSSTLPPRSILLGDRISVSQVSISSSIVTVNYLTRPDDAPFSATPSVPISKRFTLANGQLTPN